MQSAVARIFTNIASNWIGLIINIVVSFFLAPFVVNHLGADMYGIWAVAMQFTGYIYLMDFGVRDSLIRYTAKYRATGNDLAIDLVQYGSDYLLGLSTFDPEAFALRDRWWLEGDARFYQLNDALQWLGMVAFRDPVPAYKHSAAIYLSLAGRMSEPHVHASCATRPAWEIELLRPIHALVEAAKRQPAVL